MRITYDRSDFDAVCVAVFLEAWFQRDESNPPDRSTFLSELAVAAIKGALFQTRFAFAVGFSSKDGRLSLLEGFEYADENAEFLERAYDAITMNEP